MSKMEAIYSVIFHSIFKGRSSQIPQMYMNIKSVKSKVMSTQETEIMLLQLLCHFGSYILLVCKTIRIQMTLFYQSSRLHSAVTTQRDPFATGLDSVLGVAFQEDFLRDRSNSY